MLRFLHTADWHLGHNFGQFNQEQNRELQKARIVTVRAIYEYARTENIPLVFTAGDQIDSGDFTETSVLEELFALIADYPNIKTIFITGNHDPHTTRSIYKKIPPSLYPSTLFLIESSGRVCFPEHNLIVEAASLQEKFGAYNPLQKIAENHPRCPDAMENDTVFRVGITHGSLMVEGKYSPDDFPIPLMSAEDLQLDYLALGHWHSYFPYGQKTFYPGTHEPLQFEDHPSVLDVSIPSPGTSPKVVQAPIPTCFHWKTIQEEITTGSLPYFRDIFSSLPANSIIKLRLSGILAPEEYQELQQILHVIALEKNIFDLKIDDTVSIKPNLENLLAGEIDLGYLKNIITKLDQTQDINPAVREAALLYIYKYLKEEAQLC